MQHLNSDFIKLLKKEKMQELETQMKEKILLHGPGELFICPYCSYSSNKNPKGSAKRFDNSFKCFACGIWRKI